MQASDADDMPPPSSSLAVTAKTNDPPVATVGSAGRWALTLVAGFVAGVAAWLGGEACLNLIQPPRHAANSKGLVLNITDRREVANADAKNAGLAFAILGAALGTGLGLAGGLTRRSGRAAAQAALVGLVVGAGGGAGMSLALLGPFNHYKSQHPDEAARDLILPLLVHTAIWSAVGALAGLAYGFGLGDRRSLVRIVLGGLVGAAVGTMTYELIGAAAFPAAQTTQFVSATWPTRLFARLVVAVFAAAGVALAIGEQPRRPAGGPST